MFSLSGERIPRHHLTQRFSLRRIRALAFGNAIRRWQTVKPPMMPEDAPGYRVHPNIKCSCPRSAYRGANTVK